jgi:hypothetical protein
MLTRMISWKAIWFRKYAIYHREIVNLAKLTNVFTPNRSGKGRVIEKTEFQVTGKWDNFERVRSSARENPKL